MPALLGRVAGVLDALQAHHGIVVSALRGSYARDEADALIEELDRDGRALATMLRDPAQTVVTWVTLPEPMALEETADALRALDAAGVRVSRLIVNRMTPPDGETVPPKPRSGGGEPVPPKPRSGEGACAWCDARRRFVARALAPLTCRFGDPGVLAL